MSRELVASRRLKKHFSCFSGILSATATLSLGHVSTPSPGSFAPVEEEARRTALPGHLIFLVLAAVTVYSTILETDIPSTLILFLLLNKGNGCQFTIPTQGASPGSAFSLEDRIWRFNSDLLCWLVLLCFLFSSS